ncbi:hypothetical protein J23TS9_20730 [Paenibacillus sp. J23TS9]|uniref:DUF4179 domain-containing protein n=1 Tax=Paenibacillus sp. J23TS9 TaxID=2807193 RepID=UPI001B001815|nr:DUF4179 domain-containing protein [Paenibacillus sp. J23TS9]GIP26943.1 hypothetical protein J23TS9_20730 [Paenibacillus sp. J23TS9]
MNPNDFETKLKQVAWIPSDELPAIVEMKMNEAFKELPSIGVKRRSGLTYAWGSAAAVFILCLVLLASAFVSPTMAKSLKELPFIQDLFKLTQHIGLQTAEEKGMLEDINQSVTKNGVTIRITKLIYTGSSIYFVLEEDTTDHKFNNRDFSMSGKVNGEIVDMTMSRGPLKNYGRANAPSATIITISHAEYSSKDGKKYNFPDQFTLNLKIGLVDMPKEMFLFDIPVKKNETASRVVTSNDPAKEWKKCKIALGSIEFTPVMTRLTMHEDNGVRDSSERGPHFGYLLVDQDGNQVMTTGSSFGSRIKGTDFMAVTTDVDPLPKIPNSITIRPFIDNYQTGEKTFIPELEMTFPVK